MKACGGGCGRAVLLRVDRLVPSGVLQLFVDIGRQRHFPEPIQQLFKNAAVKEAHGPSAGLGHISEDLAPEKPVSEGTDRAGLQPAPGPDERFPVGGVFPAQQQDLHRDACVLLDAQQACRNDPGLVDDQRVPGIQIIDDIVEVPVLNTLICPVIDQQAAVVAGFGRSLGDQLLRELVIKIGCFHESVRSPF